MSSLTRSIPRTTSASTSIALRAALSAAASRLPYGAARAFSKQQLAAALYCSPFTSTPSIQPKSSIHWRSFSTSRDPTALLDAAGLGDVNKMQELLSRGYSANDCDYDKRRPLHIAAAEGRIDAINFLLSNGADVNAEDRYGFTPLDDALTARHDEAIALLRAKNATLGKARVQEVGPIVCQAASEGNVGHLQRLFDCGVDMNRGDYDGRSPLHLASSEGHSTTVEWLLSHGANVNAVDRFGNTPLGDAMRSRSKSRKQVTDILVRNGAVLESAQWEIKNDPSLQQSISRSLQYLLTRIPKAEFVESWIPNDDESEFTVFEGSSYVLKEAQAKLSNFLAIHGETTISNSQSHALGKAWQNKIAAIQADLTEKDVPGRFNEAKAVGLRAGFVIPLIHQEKPFALLRFYLTEIPKLSAKELEEMQLFTSGIVTAGVFKRNKLPSFNEIHDFPKNQMAEVYQKIVAEEVFNANLIYHELDWFYHLGLHKYYFERFSPRVIADHVHAFVAAKKLAAATGKPEEILLNIESKAVDGSPSFLFMCPYEHNHLVEVEKRIQMAIHKIPSTRAYTLEFFKTERPIIPGGTKQMALYVLETSEWANPKKLGSSDAAVQEVASHSFLRTKTPQIRERYQQVMTQAISKIAPLAEVYPTYRDGTIPIMFAFLQSAGTTTSYMLQLTELLKQNGMTANRKFIETFANGIIVFSLYITPCPPVKIDQLLKQFSMLHLVPESPLTAKFLNGEYTAEEYTYLSASSRFVYYFLSRRTEEFDVLSKSLKNDPLNLSRLRLLQTRLKREAVSQDRIANSVMAHPNVITELFKDFHRCATQQNPKLNAPWPVNTDLLNKIKHEATTVMDQQILNAMLTFNQHLLKTNFYTKSKSALSFRMCPDYLKESDWPTVPYGLFFLMGSDFQGFHVRFADIARGGIRVIRSTDRQAYSHNLETLFAENYGLANTQNKKNKDIPEFGSKGTILLNLGNRNSFLAFQKYVSGLVDLLVGKDEIVDNYGKTELLFLGPDEGTADFMEWAARYASKRGYPYWRSFTTGKPPSLGGIPHDHFGMTTRGVHRYVLNALSKFNLPEEKVTKFQTGGPDGDLGSNEILLSKDITKAIVDGSGVIYDPNGINREELVRLAHKRVMIKEFDASLLSPQGFRVLVSDTNVTLPDGTIVESGLAFRNEFHLNPLSSADLFVPCGGRPESVNLSNVNRLFDDKGKPRFKIVIEGANLFFSQDSRMVMENAGVVQYKDASSNKGGVTSSSLEVLASLALSAEEFDAHMAVKDSKNPPAFYMQYVQEIQHRIESDADLEFECIWREHERTKTHRYLLTDQVSDKINELNQFIQKSPLWHNKALRYKVLEEAIPKTLVKLVGLENVLQRVPENYTCAIFGAYLASRYIYKQGIEANEFAFFEFMQKYLNATQTTPAAETKEAKVEPVAAATGKKAKSK